MAQIAADELCLAWNKIKVIHALVDPVHGGVNARPYGRFTGDSLGIRLFSPTMQQAAPNAKQLLLMAAASIWRVDVSTCTAKLGIITCGTGTSLQSLTYGQVAATAATLHLSANVALNQTPKVFTGTAAQRLDIPAKVDGSAKFGVDVLMPGMVFATVQHCPTIGGTVGSVGSVGNPAAGALAIIKVGGAGITGSANYRAPTGIAVVAVTT